MSVIGRRLEQVIEDVKENMRTIAELKDEMVQVRRRSGVKPTNKEEAEKMRTDKEWLSANSTFKFLQRLGVLDQCWKIADLHKQVESGEIDVQQAIFDMD